MISTPVFDQIDRARRAVRGSSSTSTGASGQTNLYVQGGAGGAAAESVPYVKVQNVPISLALAGTWPLAFGVPGMQIEVWAMQLYAQAQNDMQLFDGAIPLTGPLNQVPNQAGFAWPAGARPHFTLSTGNSLQLTLSTAAQVSGYVQIRYVSEF